MRYRQAEPLEMNLTPMIDVVFLLIIFLVVGAKLSGDVRDIDVRLPSVNAVETSAPLNPQRSVTVDAQGRLLLDGEGCSLTELTAALRRSHQANPETAVAVLGDANVPFQHVASVMAACKTAGIRDLAVTVQIGP